jgi:hypothetical protein
VSKELLVIVPTRGRPQNAARALNAWVTTSGFDDAHLTFAVDQDDPELDRYASLIGPGLPEASMVLVPKWVPMVHKLDDVAHNAVNWYEYRYIAFMGDDHIPRTDGWARRYCAALAELGTGIVYGDDLIQGRKLCTQWAMTTDIVKALGRMVPAPVEHMYCDNSIMDLGREIDRITYLSDVKIEHAHPVAGRGAWDAGYERVNSRAQYKKDHQAYRRWQADGLARDAEIVSALIKEKTA